MSEQTLPNKVMWNTLTHMLGLNRSAEYLSEFKAIGNKMTQLHTAAQKDALETMFYDIHTQLYRDTHSLATQQQSKAGYSSEPAVRADCRRIIHAMADELFDANANAVGMEREKLGQIYANYYKQLSDLQPFDYGNGLTISTFMTAISRIPKEEEIERMHIDFRRLDDADLAAFQPDGSVKKDTTIEQLAAIFTKALDGGRDQYIPNHRAKSQRLKVPGESQLHPNDLNGTPQSDRIFKGWPDNRVEIESVPFLGVEREGKLFLVTVAGGLVPYDEAVATVSQAFRENKLVDEIPGFKPEAYLPGFPKAQEGVVDGYSYTADSQRLVCMDVNILTGLRGAAQKEFMNALEAYKNDMSIFRVPAEQVKLFNLKDAETRQAFLDKIASRNDDRLLRICKTACEHITLMTLKLEQEAEKAVAGKPRAEHPLLVISMGGSGSGKSIVTDYIRKLTHSLKDENYVFTGLDDYRKESGLYQMMQAVGHHSDDYSLVEPYANTLRSWVADKAIERSLNILYDGSAIPYKGRYDKLINDARGTTLNGCSHPSYAIDVCAADAYLDLPEGAKAKNLTTAVPERVLGRFNDPKENRCLPWPVTVNKHVHAIDAFVDAAEDSRLRNVLLFNTDGKKDNPYLAAYAFTVAPGDKARVDEALQSVDPQRYQALLAERGLGDEVSRIPYFNAENIGYTRRIHAGEDRALVITDMHKMVQMAEKGLQNQFASDLDAVHYRTGDKAAVIPSPILSGVERIIANASAQLSKVWNYVVPSDNYQQALQQKYAGGEKSISA